MKKTKKSIILAVVLSLVLAMGGLTGCGSKASSFPTDGGKLILKVNPEIAISYDSEGKVTTVEGENDDGKDIMETYTGKDSGDAKVVAKDVVNAMGDAGYFDKKGDDKDRKVTIEIEAGSKLPNDDFIEEIVEEINNLIESKGWTGKVVVEGDTDYDVSKYNDDSDYDKKKSDSKKKPATDDSDYDDDSDYAKSTPATKPATKPATNDSDYDDSDYDDDSDYAKPAPKKPANKPAKKPVTNNSDYDDSDYDDSDYDDSDYDD